MKHTLCILALTASTLGTLGSCSLDIPVENELTDPRAIVSVQTAYEALSSAYEALPKETWELSLLSDELVPTFRAGQDPSSAQLYGYFDTSLQLLASQLWEGYYSAIKDANAVLVRLPELRSQLSASEAQQLDVVRAEAEALKAYAYLQLLQLFATPYSDSARPEGILLKDRVEREDLPRASKQEVAREIERLLSGARTTFALGTRPAHGGATGFLGREATEVLLARLYLYQGDWAKAEEVTRSLTPTPIPSSLIPEESSAWATSPAGFSLWSAGVASSFYNASYTDSRQTAFLTYQLPRELYLEAGDRRRRTYSIDSTLTLDATTSRLIQLTGKYTRSIFSGTLPRFVALVRAVEPYYLRAEALTRLGREDEARTLLNSYLSAVGASPLSGSLTGGAILDAILLEKAREFAGEGLRLFDLKRLGLPITHYAPNATSVRLQLAPDDYRRTLPLPASERANRSQLKQNDGWPALIQ